MGNGSKGDYMRQTLRHSPGIRHEAFAVFTAFLLVVLGVVATVATPAGAAGTPDLSLSKEMPSEALLGADIPVTLTLTNPAGPDGYNASFTDTLPAGVSYVGGSSTPAPTVLPQSDGTTVLVWENVADALTGASVVLGYSIAADGTLDVGDIVTNAAGAHANSDPRIVPKFDPITGAIAEGSTGFDTASASTELISFELTKSEPSTEDELLRGLHDHQTVYTLTVDNNLVNPTSNFSIVDFLPAGLEFLGCGTDDNSTGGDEYPGSGPINPGNAPAMSNPCLVPSSVTTVTVDPDGAGPVAAGVYTRVEWDAATLATNLAAGGSFSIDYIAAIPLQANVDAPLVDPTANLDNNTGAFTTESETSLENYAVASGFYNGDSTASTDNAVETVVAEDVSIHKTVSAPSFEQGDNPVFTLEVETSEYTTSTGPITVTDTFPATLDFVSATPSIDSSPGQVLNPDGTITVTWTLPASATPSDTATITLATLVREFYRNGDGSNGAAVGANDSYVNTTDLTTDATIITATDGSTEVLPVDDESEVSQSSGGPSISKEVSIPAASLVCGDGTGVAFDPVSASSYRPGDRVCFRLAVEFPNALDTLSPVVTDFLPAGFTYDSWAVGAGSDVDASGLTFTQAGPRLDWTLGDTDAGGVRLELVIQTIVGAPSEGAPGDLIENLMKMRYSNLDGEVFQLRDGAIAEWSEPEIALDKAVIAVNGTPLSAPTDGVTVQEGDTVTYQVAVSNSGTVNTAAVSVRDVLPPGITCADVDAGSISNGGACDAANNWIQWDADDGIDVAIGTTVNLSYDVLVPTGISAGASLINTAGVRSFTAETNTGTPYTYVPDDNIDPTLTSNTDPADDTSEITTAPPTIDKAVTTAITEAGNNAPSEATIGEIVSYTVTLDLPAGATYYNAEISDPLDASKDLDATSVVALLDGAALPAGFTLTADDAGNSITVDFPAVYSIPNGADQQIVLTFDARVTDVTANVRAADSDNRADFDFENVAGDERNVNASAEFEIVEPNITVAKSNNDTDGVVSAGQTVTYSLEVSNDDSIANVSTAHDSTVVDVIPPELIVDVASISAGGVFTAGATASDPSIITWTIASIDPGDSVTLTYDIVTADPLVAAGSLTNEVTATTTSLAGTDPNERIVGAGYSDTDDSTVTVPVLSVTKTGTPDTATVGETVTYTVDVDIPGGVVAYDVTVIDDLPAGLTFESLTLVTCDEGGATCSPDIATSDAAVVEGAGDIAIFFDDLLPAAAGARTVSITYVAYVSDVSAADDGSTLTNGAAIYWNSSDVITSPPSTPPSPSDFDGSSPVASDDVDTLEPTLTIDKNVVGQNADDDVRRAVPGDVLEYSITVTNTGTSDAHNVNVFDLASDDTWAFNDTTVVAGVTNTDAIPSGGLEWTIDGPIAPLGSVTITYELIVPAGFDSSNEVAAGPEQSNTADIPSYFGVDEATRTANPDRDFRDYDDVVADTVDIEVDLASIGDVVWLDVNNDGVQDAGEPPLSGVDVTVTYLGPDGAPGGGDDEAFTVTTNATGTYLVDQLPGGEYIVVVDATDLLPGLSPSYDLDGGTTSPNGSWAGTLGENEDKDDVDFGYTGTGSIGDTIWLDQDLDGVLDTNETGIAGIDVTVTWLGPDNAIGGGDDVVYIATTDANGVYLVEDLPAGDYTVEVDTADLPAGFGNVSDPEGNLDDQSSLTLGVGEANLDQDFGYAGAGSIGDYIWLDQNGDGVQDGSEPGLGGVIVVLTYFGPDGVPGGGDDATFTTMTDASGGYLFENLPPGEYEVEVTGALPANVVNSFDPDTAAPGNSSSSVTLGDGENNTDQDFGYEATSVLGDRVWWDLDGDGIQDPGEPGLNGVEVTATYLGPDGVLGGVDDEVFVITTNGDGDYIFQNIPDGDYIVAVTDSVPAGLGATFDEDSGITAPDETTDVALVAEHLTADFGYRGTSSIGDTIWFDTDADGVLDANEFGLEGVLVELTWFGPDGVAGGGDDITLTTTTDADGEYLFPNLPAGEFDVTVDASTLPAGLTATYDEDNGTTGADGTTPVTLGTGEDIDTVDFGYNGTGSIGDTIWFDQDGDGAIGPDEVGLGNVDVTLVWDSPTGPQTFTTTTAADGSYDFPNLPPGDYTVTVDTGTLPPGMAETFDQDGGFDSTSSLTLGLGEDNDDQDFGYNGSATVGDTIYLDLDGDGVQGADEPGVAGQLVELTWQGPTGPVTMTTTTDANGNYSFTNLPDGDYTVTVVGGIVDAADNSGDPGADGDSTNDFSISGGVDNLDQDFGYQGNNIIGDTVWFDTDANGVFDGIDVGLEGIEVTVVWFGPDGVAGGGDDVTLPVATTDGDGLYTVPNLPDGSYSVTLTGGVPVGTDENTFDADGSLDGTSVVTDLGVGTNDPVIDLDQDFGLTGSGSIGDTIWLDLNGDGVQDPGEPGIPGATVILTAAGPDGILGTADDVIYPTATTGPDGTYLFENLPAGDFSVVVSNLPPGVQPTADPDGGNDDASMVTLDPGEADLDQDFGYVGSASIGDTVWLDVNTDGVQDPNEPGIAGVTVTVTSGGADGVLGTADDIVVTVPTDVNGQYLVEGLPSGPTSVSYQPTDLDAGLVPNSDLDGGDLSSTVVVLNPGDAIRDVDFGVVGDASISGVIFIDTDTNGEQGPGEAGIPGVTVIITWDGPDGPVTITVETAADGSWSIDQLPAGDYTVEIDQSTVPDGLVATTPTDDSLSVANGETAATQAGFVPAASIGDTVWSELNGDGTQGAGEPGVPGVTVTLVDPDGNVVATTVTDADGMYSFDDLVPGTYTVEIDTSTLPAGTVIVSDPEGVNDGSAVVTVAAGEELTTIDFGIGDPGLLPSTGGNVRTPLLFGLMALLLGSVLVLAGRRRVLLIEA